MKAIRFDVYKFNAMSEPSVFYIISLFEMKHLYKQFHS